MDITAIIDTEATICAVSTPQGVGGISVIRVSGREAIANVQKIWRGKNLMDCDSHTAHFGEIIDPVRPEDAPVDECVVTLFRGPGSFTGEDTVEISVHGSRWIQREVIRLLTDNGCRPALAGEFTRRAVMNGRIDLTQAEAVADVIASSSRAAHRLAASQLKGNFSRRVASLRDSLLELASLLELELDFSEEDVEFASRDKLRSLAEQIRDELGRLHASYSTGAAIKEGIPVAIIGAPNAGKSSLLNLLLSDDRAIVTDIPGTTRDTVEETLESGDYLFRFIDTAGIRDTSDPIEQLGISRSIDALRRAHIILLVIDSSSEDDHSASISSTLAQISPQENDQEPDRNLPYIIPLLNKSDKSVASPTLISTVEELIGAYPHSQPIPFSTVTAQGVPTLLEALQRAVGASNKDVARQGTDKGVADTETIMVTNARHAMLLGEAVEHASKVITALDSGLPTDLVASHLRDTLSTLSTLTGTITTPDILSNIFENFCIGK